MIYLRLFFEFFKVGLFAIGGGLSTFPFLESLAEKTGWFTMSDLVNMIAVSEATPGPIGVNMSTYAGVITAGVAGGIVSTLGLITPSVIIILIVAKFLDKFRDSFYVESAFYGLRPAVMGLIAAAGFSVFKTTLFSLDALLARSGFFEVVDIKAVALFIVSFFAIKKLKISPIICILGSAALGMVLYSMPI